MAEAIVVEELRKEFRIRKPSAAGLASRVAGFLRPRHGTVEAVAGVTFKVAEGETLAFIGPNGAGKSTTIKMLTGILHPNGGTAEVLGCVPWRERVRLAHGIGSVFGQKSQLWLHLPALDTFNLLARIYDLDRKRYGAWRDELVRLFDVADLVRVPVRKLSLGQRMRCELVASLLHEPRVLFLDEPTIGIDPVAKATIRDLIRKANREHGVTVFLTSHDAGDIEHLCRRVIIVNHGRIVFDDAVNELRRSFLTRKEVGIKVAGDTLPEVALEGVEVLKRKGAGLKLRVDTSRAPIDRVLSGLLGVCEIEDITIENVPMEEIIASIYRQQAGGGA